MPYYMVRLILRHSPHFAGKLLATLSFTCVLGFAQETAVEMPEAYFPELKSVLRKLPQTSSLLDEERQRLKEAAGGAKVARSASGLKLRLNLQGQSIHEDRPNQDFHHRYRFLGSAYLKKPLYHWGALKAEREIGELNERRASLRFKSSEKSLTSEVRSHYLNLVLFKYEIQLAKETLSVARKNEEDLSKRQDLGLGTALGVDEAIALRLQQEIQLSNLESQFLKQSSLFDDFVEADSNLSFERTPAFLDFCENHPFSPKSPILVSRISFQEVEEIELEVENEKRRIVIAESQLKPKFNLIGGVFQDQVAVADNRENLTRNNLLIGVEANWAIWDSKKSTGEKEIALARKRRYELSAERLSRSLRIELESLRNSLLSLGKNIEVTRQLVKVAENRYEKSLIEFELNRITPIAHFETRISLDQSRLALLQAVIHYQKTNDRYLTRITFDTEDSSNP